MHAALDTSNKNNSFKALLINTLCKVDSMTCFSPILRKRMTTANTTIIYGADMQSLLRAAYQSKKDFSIVFQVITNTKQLRLGLYLLSNEKLARNYCRGNHVIPYDTDKEFDKHPGVIFHIESIYDRQPRKMTIYWLAVGHDWRQKHICKDVTSAIVFALSKTTQHDFMIVADDVKHIGVLCLLAAPVKRKCLM